MAGSEAKEKIISAAFQLFHENGYNGTSIQDIVNAAELPKGTFYNHFKSKELLAIEVLSRYSDAIGATLTADSLTSPLGRLRHHFECLASAYRSAKYGKGCMFGNFTAEMAATSVIREALQVHMKVWLASIQALLDQAVVQNELTSETDTKMVAMYLLDLFQGATLRSKLELSGTAINQFLDIAFSKILVKR